MITPCIPSASRQTALLCVGWLIVMTAIGSAAPPRITGTLLHNADSLDTVRLSWGRENDATRLELNSDKRFLRQGKASLRLSSVTDGQRRQAYSYAGCRLDCAPLNLAGRKLLVDVWSSTPAALSTISIRGLNRLGKRVAGWRIHPRVFSPSGQQIALIPEEQTADIRPEDPVAPDDAIVAIDVVVGSKAPDGTPFDLYLDNLQFALETDGDTLELTPTAPITPDDLTYEPRRKTSLFDGEKPAAVIVRPDQEPQARLANLVQEAFATRWGVTFPLVSPEEARAGDNSLILTGPVNASILHSELAANRLLLAPKEGGYELRTLPEVLDWGPDVLYIGGPDDTAVRAGLNVFFTLHPTAADIPHMIACEAAAQATLPSPESLLEEMRAMYESPGFSGRKNDIERAIRTYMVGAATGYSLTANEAYARALGDMLVIYAAERQPRQGETVTRPDSGPEFEFQRVAQAVWAVEQAAAFTAEDRWRAAEIMRRTSEQILQNYSMKPPLDAYAQGRQEYMTNHLIFACRAVSTAARYLLSRHRYAPARLWKAVADNGMEGVAPHPYSPEDAAGYQFLVYEIFTDYAIASGRYGWDFFDQPIFRQYIEDVKAQWNHLGYTSGYGDAYPQYSTAGWRILQRAVSLFGDDEAEYILDLASRSTSNHPAVRSAIVADLQPRANLPPPGPHTQGLHLVEMVPFKQEFYEVKSLLQPPLLDKAIFRSGWDSKANFLALNGINNANHGHFEANAVNQYVHGDRLWIFDGDYLRGNPEDQNSITVSRNGLAPDRRFKRWYRSRGNRRYRVSRITGRAQIPGSAQASLSLLLENYGGMDWTRACGFLPETGFWVVDSLQARSEGTYCAQVLWRVTGTMEEKGQAIRFQHNPAADPSMPWHLSIAEGSGAQRHLETRFERGHGRRNGHLLDYEGHFPDRRTKCVHFRRRQDLQTGENLEFIQFIAALPGEDPSPVEIEQVAPRAWKARTATGPHLAVMGPFSQAGLHLDATIAFLSPTGVLAHGLISLRLAGFEISGDGADQAIPAASLPPDAWNAFWNHASEASHIMAPGAAAVQELPLGRTVAIPLPAAEASALAGAPSGFALGTQQGDVILCSPAGEITAQTRVPAGVSALAAWPENSTPGWAAACFPADTGTGNATLHRLNMAASHLWEREIPADNRRNGTMLTLFPARLHADGPPVLVGGSESNWYYAIDNDGKTIWKTRITHGATVGAAGDMTGNGTDEIAAGTEYYWHCTLDAAGKVARSRTTSAWDTCAMVEDINADGIKEAVMGRHDGWVYCQTPEENPIRNWNTNVGGRPTGLALIQATPQAPATVAVATAMGEVVLLDADGKRSASVTLPAPLTDLVAFAGDLFTACLDGFVYRLDAHGTLHSKYPYSYAWSAIMKPRLAVSESAVALASGPQLWILQP